MFYSRVTTLFMYGFCYSAFRAEFTRSSDFSYLLQQDRTSLFDNSLNQRRPTILISFRIPISHLCLSMQKPVWHRSFILLSSRSDFGFEFAEIFVIDKGLPISPSRGVDKIAYRYNFFQAFK
jgi:hypothetical protein